MSEIWEPINGFEHQYSISNHGNVKNYKTGKLLKPIDQSILRVSLYDKNHKSYNRSIANLVASAFLSNPNDYKYVIHIDGDHTNNNVSNLMWSKYPANNKHNTRKPIPVYCKELDTIFNSYRECEVSLGLSQGSLYQYFKAKRKSIKGYTIIKLN